MNRTEHILTCLGEEGVEVAKEAHKANRFGLDDKLTRDPNGPRGTEGPTTRDKIVEEFIDMLGAYQKAVDEGLLPDIGLARLPDDVTAQMARKGERIEAFMGYAARVGTLNEDAFAS